MHKIIKTIINFENLCKRKLARNKSKTMPNMSSGLAKKRQEMLIDQKIKLHNRLYACADKLIKEYDPCKIENGKCARTITCCRGCKYLTKNGCSIKCLWCKLWLCDYLLKKPEYRPLVLRLKKIEEVAYRKKLMIHRGSKEDLIKHLKRWKTSRRKQ